MNGRRRQRFTLLVLADVVAIAATIAAVAIVAGRFSQRSEAAPTPPPAPAAVAPQQEPAARATRRKVAAPTDDCRRKGITRAKGNEGTCFRENGRQVRVVNRSTLLKLPELDARLLDLKIKRRPVQGVVDLDVLLEIRSKVDDLVTIAPEQVGLHVGDTFVSPDGALNSLDDDSLIGGAVLLRPRSTIRGSARFRVSPDFAASLNWNAELWIAQFSDGSPKIAGRTVGVFRTYR